MKAKISALDPCGVVLEEVQFDIPLINDGIYGTATLTDGMVIPTEPMKKSRYLLEIGKFKYILYQDGYVDRAGHEEK